MKSIIHGKMMTNYSTLMLQLDCFIMVPAILIIIWICIKWTDHVYVSPMAAPLDGSPRKSCSRLVHPTRPRSPNRKVLKQSDV